MKPIAGIGLLGFLALLAWWMSTAAGGQGAPASIGIAFGSPQDDEVEMNVVVDVVMAALDRLDQEEGKMTTWPEWIEDHFILEDSDGDRVPFRRLNNSTMIKQLDIRGTQEFFLSAQLDVGEDYTFDYVPFLDKDKRYRYTFTAPAAAEKIRYRILPPVP